MLIGVFFICWLDRLLEGGSLRGSYPIIRFPMTKYLFLILMLISPGEGAGVKRKPVDQLPRLIGSPTPDGLESGGLSLDLSGDDGLLV